MKIAIIVAMSKEMDLLAPHIVGTRTHRINGRDVLVGQMCGHDVVAMQCGIGKVNAAMGATLLIKQFAPDYVINTGVAGGAGGHVAVMDVVVADRVAYHDVWCGPESVAGEVQGLPLYFPGNERLLAAVPKRDNIHVGLTCSGDQFIDTNEAVQRITSLFPDVLAVDMESCAIAQVCYLCKTPFMSLRVISDSPGASHDNTRQYTDFWEEAPQKTFGIVQELLANL